MGAESELEDQSDKVVRQKGHCEVRIGDMENRTG